MKFLKEIKGGLAIDDRGSLSYVNDFDSANLEIKRFYIVQNHEAGFVRAWHGHRKEKKYVMCIDGSALLAVVPMNQLNTFYATLDSLPNAKQPEFETVTLDSRQPRVLQIPEEFYNGFKLLTSNSKLLFFSTTTLEEAKDDDYRLQYSIFTDPLIVKER